MAFGDRKYRSHALADRLRGDQVPYRVEVVSRPDGVTGFHPLPVRWVVERTLAWLGRYRRLSKDYEHRPASAEAVVHVAAIHHRLRRLRPAEVRRTERFRFKRKPRKRSRWPPGTDSQLLPVVGGRGHQVLLHGRLLPIPTAQPTGR